MVNDDTLLFQGTAPALGVAPLSAITSPPVEFIRAAHHAGFASVGLRVAPITPADLPFPMDTSSTAFADIVAALDDTGLTVADIEVFSVTLETTRDQWMPVLEVGRALGARYLNVVCDDPSPERFAQTMAALTADAHEHDLQPVLEPVAYRPLNSFPRAIEIAREVGCAVELDALHFLRTGAAMSDIRDNADIFPILQICDAPANLASVAAELEPRTVGDSLHGVAIAESRARRLLPGQGAVPIRELRRVLSPDVVLSVEIPNVALRGDLPAADYLSLLHRATIDYFVGSAA